MYQKKVIKDNSSSFKTKKEEEEDDSSCMFKYEDHAFPFPSNLFGELFSPFSFDSFFAILI